MTVIRQSVSSRRSNIRIRWQNSIVGSGDYLIAAQVREIALFLHLLCLGLELLLLLSFLLGSTPIWQNAAAPPFRIWKRKISFWETSDASRPPPPRSSGLLRFLSENAAGQLFFFTSWNFSYVQPEFNAAIVSSFTISRWGFREKVSFLLWFLCFIKYVACGIVSSWPSLSSMRTVVKIGANHSNKGFSPGRKSGRRKLQSNQRMDGNRESFREMVHLKVQFRGRGGGRGSRSGIAFRKCIICCVLPLITRICLFYRRRFACVVWIGGGGLDSAVSVQITNK